MSGDIKQLQGDQAYDNDAMSALSKVLGDAGKRLIGQSDAQQTAITALTAIIIASPATAAISQERLAAVLYALSGGKAGSEDTLKKAIAYASMIVTMAQKLPELETQTKAEVAAEKAAGGASKKPN